MGEGLPSPKMVYDQLVIILVWMASHSRNGIVIDWILGPGRIPGKWYSRKQNIRGFIHSERMNEFRYGAEFVQNEIRPITKFVMERNPF